MTRVVTSFVEGSRDGVERYLFSEHLRVLGRVEGEKSLPKASGECRLRLGYPNLCSRNLPPRERERDRSRHMPNQRVQGVAGVALAVYPAIK